MRQNAIAAARDTPAAPTGASAASGCARGAGLRAEKARASKRSGKVRFPAVGARV
jgi:hypothetical protein